MKTKVAVIGAGPSGLSALRAFATARNRKEKIPEVVCFEKQADWGGQWRYNWRVGSDENGEPVQSSMYRFLWSNGPKECLEFADYSFEKHFGKPIPSYPPREPLADYIMGRAKNSRVRSWIRFECPVRHVEAKKGGGFTVTAHDYKSGKETHETFSHVICATGHFSVPNYPEFEGIETFPGRVLHAHDFRSADEFKGQHVLVVGASYSAEDIGLQCKKYGAKSVTFTYRTAAMGFKWPRGMDERSLMKKVQGRKVTFKNRTSKEFDAIILCTGYQHSFPFMDAPLRLETTNRLYSPGLYKGVVWNANPDVFYIGMQDQWYTFTMFDAEAWYARDVIMGKTKLPGKAARTRDMNAWTAREEALPDASAMIDFQADYVRELMKYTDYPAFDIELTQAEFKKWKKAKAENIATYRDKSHTSPVTGNPQPIHHTKWWKAMDDSMKTFLATK